MNTRWMVLLSIWLTETSARILVLACASACALELPENSFSALGSVGFRDRETAQAELLKWSRNQPEPAMVELLRQSRIAEDPEVRERCLDILRDLVTDQYSKEGEGYIGVALKDEISDVPGDPKPRSVIRITEVRMDTPGHQAGIRLNDLVVGLDGETWQGMDASPRFRERIRMMKPSTKVELKIVRDGKLIVLGVILGRRPLEADNPFFNGRNLDTEASERVAKEAYFRRWLDQRKPRK